MRLLFFILVLCARGISAAIGEDSALPNPPNLPNRPNIVFIFSDDHAYQAISAYGADRNSTPQIDRLAREGMRFTNCCVTNSICGPSRAVIQTGKHSHLNGFKTHFDKFNIEQQTMPKLMQQAGYETAVIGKWHLACDVKGYDYSEVLIDQGPYYNPPMIRNGKRVEHSGHTTEIITQLAIDWMKNRGAESENSSEMHGKISSENLSAQAAQQKPFLLMVQHKAPHRNWQAYPKHYAPFAEKVFPHPETFDDDYSTRGRAAREQEMLVAELTPADLKLNSPGNLTPAQKDAWIAMYGNRPAEFELVKDDPRALKNWKYQCYLRDYMSCVAAVDESVGQLLDYLDASGLSENTVVIYSSDQGFYLGEHGWYDKRFMYQESFKTPLLVRWQGKTQVGSVNESLVSNLDFPETFLDLAAAPIPSDMQGFSLVPILKGEAEKVARDVAYYHYYEFPGEHRVKRHEGVYDGRYKLIHFYYDVDEWEFFDLANDPHELNNCYADPNCAAEVARMHAALENAKEKLQVPEIMVSGE